MSLFEFILILQKLFKMALLFRMLWVSVLISLSFAESNSTLDEGENTSNNETSVSPQLNMSPFLFSFYNGLSSEKIFDKIFDTSFSPRDVAPSFYRYSFFIARQLGVRHPGPFSARLAVASKKAFKNITPLKYFKVYGNTMESFFSVSGLLKKHDQKQLLQSFVKYLKEGLISVGGSGPKAGLRALAVGSVNMFKSLGKFTPDQIKSILVTFTKEMNKVE